MARSRHGLLQQRIDETSSLLEALGLSVAQQNERSALTLLALASLLPRTPWADANQPLLRTVDIMEFMRTGYRKKYAANSRETIRRQTLHQFIESGIVDQNPDLPSRPTNSGHTRYALTDAALTVVRRYGSPNFSDAVVRFHADSARLREIYQQSRDYTRIPVVLPDDQEISLTAGEHNLLQKAVIEEFGPRFAPGAKVLYLGDTAKKHVLCDHDALQRLSVRFTTHDKLPDIVMHRADVNWLYLIEAVTSHGPFTATRLRQLKRLLTGATAGLVFVSAFPTRAVFRRHVAEIAWETEVWIASDPEHLIHFNGTKFMGPFEH